MTALRSEGVKKIPTVLMGGSQGTSSTLATLNWLNDENQMAVLYANAPWITLIKINPAMLSIYLRSIFTETNYYRLASTPLEKNFDVQGKMTAEFVHSYLNGDYPQVETFLEGNIFLHQIPAGFKGEASLWHFREDVLLRLQSSIVLHQEWQKAGDVSQENDCRERALVTKVVL